MRSNQTRLGVNIDHVATLRQLRSTPYPDLLKAAQECMLGGADQITVHLREDRRHICDQDVELLAKNIKIDLNLEMAATQEMLNIALMIAPHSICIVPEKRQERTTEGGLDFSNHERNRFLAKIAHDASESKILVSFFIEPTKEDIKHSIDLGARAVELHTGALCIAHQQKNAEELAKQWKKLHLAIEFCNQQKIYTHLGHGIDYKIAEDFSKLTQYTIDEYNIGHSIICESIFIGLNAATKKMKKVLLNS